MKAASSEITLIIVAIVAIGAVLTFILTFIANREDDAEKKIDDIIGIQCTFNERS